MKGELIGHGTNIFRMMDFCHNAKPQLTKENSILEFDVTTDELWIYKKINNNQ